MSLRTIAAQLGVSVASVSLALHDSPRISAALKARVRAAAQAAGHVPNARLGELMHQVRQSRTPAFRATLGVVSLFPQEAPWQGRGIWDYLEVFLHGARARAEAHGYRLENFWLKAPGLTPERLRAILEARGIKGLLCLGSLDPEERFPTALEKFAVVTQGASIPQAMHRVVSHFAEDARVLLIELHRRGYARPGLVILESGDRRTDHLYSARFLSAQHLLWPRHPAVPLLRAETWDEGAFHAWFTAHRPDVLVLHQHAPYLAALKTHLARRRIRVPRDLGIALLDLNPDPARYSGIRQDFTVIGATAAEMLIGRLLLRDFGPPRQPKVELVVGTWNEGRTLRRANATRAG